MKYCAVDARKKSAERSSVSNIQRYCNESLGQNTVKARKSQRLGYTPRHNSLVRYG